MNKYKNKLTTIFCALVITFGGFALAQGPPAVDTVASSVTEAANLDAVSNEDLAIWYSIYRGSYLYGTKFNFDGSTDFGKVFSKQVKVRDTLLPSKTDKLKGVINGVFKKYEELPFDDNSKNKFLEECDSVARGLRAAID